MTLSVHSTNSQIISRSTSFSNDSNTESIKPNNVCQRVNNFIAGRKRLKFASTSITLLNVIATPFVALSLIPIGVAITAGIISVIAIIILARSESKKVSKIQPLIKDIIKCWSINLTEQTQIEMHLRKLKKSCTINFNLDAEDKSVLLGIDPSWEELIIEKKVKSQKTKNEKTAYKELLDSEKRALLEQVKQNGSANIEELYKPTPLSTIKYKQSGRIKSDNSNSYMAALLQAMHNCASLRNIFRQKIIARKESIDYLISETEINKNNKSIILTHISNVGNIDDITDKLLLNLKIMLSKEEEDLSKPNEIFSNIKKILVLNTLSDIVAKNNPIPQYEDNINIKLQRSLNSIIGKLNASEEVSKKDLNALIKGIREEKPSHYNHEDSDILFKTLDYIFNISGYLGNVYEKSIQDEDDDSTPTHLEPFLCHILQICSEDITSLDKALISQLQKTSGHTYKLNCVPFLLPITINRSHYKKINNELVQINPAITMPLKFDAPKDLFSKEQDDIKYELNSVICHIEETKNDRYITYRRTAGNKWLCCDNSNISEMDKIPDGHLKQNSHMLFYERIDNQ